MEECKKYLREAKEKQWTIIVDDLMAQFSLTETEVDQCIREIFSDMLPNKSEKGK